MENIKDIVVIGGLYSIKHGWKDLTSGVAIAHQSKNDPNVLYMIDTYDLYNTSEVGDSYSDVLLKSLNNADNFEFISESIGLNNDSLFEEFHIKKIESKEDLYDFDFICDLHDYRTESYTGEADIYDLDDVLYNVNICHDTLPNFNLIRKDAKVDKCKSFEKQLEHIDENGFFNVEYPSKTAIDKITAEYETLVNDSDLYHVSMEEKYERIIERQKFYSHIRELVVAFENHLDE